MGILFEIRLNFYFWIMTAKSHSSHIIESYLELFLSLSKEERVILLKELEEQEAKDAKAKDEQLRSTFGSYQGEESAEELTNTIRTSRHFNRKSEEF